MNFLALIFIILEHARCQYFILGDNGCVPRSSSQGASAKPTGPAQVGGVLGLVKVGYRVYPTAYSYGIAGHICACTSATYYGTYLPSRLHKYPAPLQYLA